MTNGVPCLQRLQARHVLLSVLSAVEGGAPPPRGSFVRVRGIANVECGRRDVDTTVAARLRHWTLALPFTFTF